MKAGFRQFIFISEDIGSYGFDIQENLPQLLNTLNKATENNSIRWQLDGLNPIWAVKYESELLPLIRKDRIYAITIPFQSGSKRILKLMNRFSDIERIDKCIKNFRKQYKLLRLHSVFMIGFPSETEEDFKETLRFIVDINPEIVTFTFYSEFEHCKSAEIFPKISNEIVDQRRKFAVKYLERRNICVKI
jgi:tRNA A37 methylthiotransferase MiaB